VLSPRGFAVALLAVAGALTGHWTGTTLADPSGLVDHGYLGPVGIVLTPAAIAASAWLTLRGARRVGLADLSVSHLIALQVAVFVAQELVELAGAGLPLTQFLTEPAILLGLAAQLPVAFVIRFAVRLAAALVASAPPRRRVPPGPSILPFAPAVAWTPHALTVAAHGPRGPPRRR